MLALLHAAGWPIWLLLATSVIGLALIIERLLNLRDSRYIDPQSISDAFEQASLPQVSAHRLRELGAQPGFGRVASVLIELRHLPEAPVVRQPNKVAAKWVLHCIVIYPLWQQ